MIARLRDAVARALTGMTAEDRARWSAAESMADVGELTAQWLEGKVATQPGYGGPVDTDEDLAPGMTATLVATNRAGFVTYQSQAGADGQQAAVAGLATADYLDQIDAATADEPALVVVDLGEPDAAERAPVGWYRDERELSATWGGYGACGPKAVAELTDAAQLCIYDSEPSRNDRLWPALQRAADQATTTDEEVDEA
jgi:hypothetical protein